MRALAPALCVVLSACTPEASSRSLGPPEEELRDTLEDLSADFGGDGKSDLFGVDPCAVLEPLFVGGVDYTKVGLVAGVSGQAVLGAGTGYEGYDLVWDLYHQQMTVSHFRGAGIALPGAGASVTAFTGIATGFRTGVTDWNGFFVASQLDLSLPFLRDFLSLSPQVFISAVDGNSDGLIGPDEFLFPPDGVYGFQVGVTLGFDLLPDGLPVGGSLTEGYWQPHQSAIRHYYDLLRSTRIARIGSTVAVGLVDAQTGAACPDDWPASGDAQSCVLQFGNAGMSHTRRALHLAYGICTSLGGCEVALS